MFNCGSHVAEVFAMGGVRKIADLAPLSMVRWQRIRDDISVAEVIVPSQQCCEVLADLRCIRNELHISRLSPGGYEKVWEGPITRIEYERDVTRIFAEDVLWQAKRSVIQETYDQSYPNIWKALDRISWLINHCYSRYNDPWRMAGHSHPVFGSEDPNTARIVFAWQMYVWDDLDKYGEDYGIDYTVYKRDIYYWDSSLRWLTIPDLDDTHLTQAPRIVEYGNQAATRGIVTNANGYAGVSDLNVEAFALYGTVIDWLTTNGMDGSPGLVVNADGDVVPDPEAPRAPTDEEVAGWKQTATRSVLDRSPTPVAIVVPAGTSLVPGAPWEMHHLVPGAWFRVNTTRLCRTVSEWQRLQEVVVEESERGESVSFTCVAAPEHVVEVIGPPPPPPS